ncbi:MAG TPA: murein biosynthesis integral membrane protein MurJ [Planctomycetota bacterium]|jgi:putative peptidoglycan lipid II flippase|nr:murein biosynthesis integral membrane protein MurJ [Planctomycetota bacterium]
MPSPAPAPVDPLAVAGEATGAQILRASGVVASCTLASRVLGLVRDSLGAATFGAGWVYGAFQLGWLLPNLFRRLFGEGALASAFIPAFARASRDGGTEAARRLVASVAWALLGVLGGLAVAAAAAALLLPPRWIAPLLGEAAAAGLVLRVSAILSPYLLLVCLYALATGVLNSRGRFFPPAVAPAVLNLVWIAGFAFLALLPPGTLEEGAVLLAFFVLAGGVAQLALQLPALRSEGFLVRPRLDRNDPGFREVVRDMVPIVLGLSLVQVNLVVDQLVAWALISPGANTYVYLGNRLLQFPLSMVGMAAASASFPALAERAAARDFPGFRRALDRTLGLVVFLAAPAGAGLFVLAEPVTRLLFGHGRFGPADVAKAAGAVGMFALGVPFLCAAQILARAHYALGDTRTPVRIAAILVLVNFALNLLLVRPLGVAGLALATTLGSAANGWALARKLRARGDVPGTAGLRGSLLRSALGALACGLAAFAVRRACAGAGLFPSVAAAVGAGAAATFVAAAWLRSGEVRDLRAAFARRRSR